MSYSTHKSNGELSIQEHTAAAVQEALNGMKSKKRKREMADMGTGGPQSAPKRGSASSMNGNNHENNNLFLDSSNSNDFSNLSQQLQAATSQNHGLPTTGVSNTAAAALAGIMPQMTIPQPTDMSFASTASNTEADRHFDSSFDMGGDSGGHGQHGQGGSQYNLNSFPGNTAAQVQAARESSNGVSHKPSVGTEEWHKVRRDNHKEVERRRRETINEGINELAKIVPGCEKNKGSILQRAVEYITQLKTNEQRNLEKWTQEKMLTEGVVSELSTSVDGLKRELERARREAGVWKKIAVDAGLGVGEGGEQEDDDDDGFGTDTLVED
ncbi:MAG: hypothetical protein Q9201_005182, partial [Fulgogasparrea decipioides]